MTTDLKCNAATAKRDHQLSGRITVSVIIPVRNSRNTVIYAIQSVLKQTFNVYEIIVIDDGSTDGLSEEDVCLLSNVVKYVRVKASSGANHARNLGIDLAKGDWVSFLDADDTWHEEKLERQTQAIHRIADIEKCIIFCNATLVRGDFAERLLNEPITADCNLIRSLMASRFSVITSTIMLHRNLAQRLRFDEGRGNLQDLDFFIRAVRAGAEAVYLPMALTFYSVTEKPLRISNQSRKVEYAVDWYQSQRNMISMPLLRCHFVDYCFNVAFMSELGSNWRFIRVMSGGKFSGYFDLIVLACAKLLRRFLALTLKLNDVVKLHATNQNDEIRWLPSAR